MHETQETHAGKSAPHLFYQWRGSPFEIGRQHGSTLSDAIRDEFAPALCSLSQGSGVSQDEILARILEHYHPLFETYAPRALEEIRGLAQGANLDYSQAFFAATRDGMKALRILDTNVDECTAFFCAPSSTRNGEVLLGQTKDTRAPLERHRIQKVFYSDTNFGEIRLNYPGWTSNIGINSQGVGCTGNSLYGPPSRQATVPFSLARRIILDSDSARQAMEILDELPLENCCFLIADASGNALCIESLGGERAVLDISHRTFGHANTTLSPGLQSFDQSAQQGHNSALRQQNISCLLEDRNGVLDADVMENILADHRDFPLSICRHYAPEDTNVTTAAFIADLAKCEMRIAIGNPCIAPFVTYSLNEPFSEATH